MNELMAQPIPGMSLTGTPGNTPWEQPPQFVELDDVVKYYVEKLTEEATVDGLLRAMKADAPLVSMANTLIKAGMMKGIHSIDVGFLAVPILVELMKTIGDMNDVGYVVEAEDYQAATEVDETTAKEVLAQAIEEVKQAPEVVAQRRSGLMGKGE